MKRIEIFEDHRGTLCLRQYTSDGKIDFNLRNADIYGYLETISRESIKKVKTATKEGVIHSIGVVTPNYEIGLLELEKLQKHEEYVLPITEKIEKFIDDNNIKAYKEQAQTGKAPRVTRENKYSKFKTEIALIFAGLLTVGGILGYLSKGDEITPEYQDEQVPPVPVITKSEEQKEPVLPYIILEDESIDVTPSVEKKIEENTICVSLDCEDLCNNEKNTYVKENYGSVIEKYATRYGVDPNIMIAIATQERGVHSSTKDKGGATGLMQIQNGVWVGEEISAYNYETGKKDSFKVTNENIGRLEENIMFGCMYFQNCMRYMDNNVFAAVQCYNMGNTSVKKIVNAYAKTQGTTVSSILNDPIDLGWMDYRYLVPKGDQEYVENVFRYLDTSSKTMIYNRDNTSYGIQIIKNIPIKTM